MLSGPTLFCPVIKATHELANKQPFRSVFEDCRKCF